LKLSIFNDCDACRVVPAIFERPKTAHDDGYRILRTDVSEYAAHAVTGYQRDEPSITLAFRDRLSNTLFSLSRRYSTQREERAGRYDQVPTDRERIALMQPRSSTETDFARRLRLKNEGRTDFRILLRRFSLNLVLRTLQNSFRKSEVKSMKKIVLSFVLLVSLGVHSASIRSHCRLRGCTRSPSLDIL
jgi:hypothetical protein